MLKNYKFYIFFFIIFILLTSYSIYDYKQYNEDREKQAMDHGKNKRDEIKLILNTALDSIEKTTTILAEKLSEKQYSKNQLEEIIEQTALDNDFCHGLTVAFEPEYAEDTVKQLYAPYFSKKNRQIQFVENTYDYTNASIPSAQWYTQVIEQNDGVWSNPYVAQVAQELVVDYGVPFYKKDASGTEKINGVISFTIAASYITSYLHDITLGKTGFALITNKDLFVIAHPDTEILTKPEIVREKLKQNPEYNIIAKEVEGHFSSFNEIAQENSENFYTTLNQGWVLTTVIPKHDLIDSSNRGYRKLIHISIFLSLSIIMLLILTLKIWQGNNKNLWIFSLLIGLLFLTNIIFIWFLNRNDISIVSHSEETKILSNTTINNYLIDRNKKLNQIDSSLKCIEIPTGIFVYDIDFKDAYDVSIIGKIWQKIPDNFELKSETSFVFPQASATGISVRIRPMSKEHMDGYWLYSYDFNATFQFDFNYLKYPLNIKKLNLQITYPHLKDNVVLTPDIHSYDFINPTLKPGVSDDIYMPNSTVLSSYFSFHEHNFHGDLGNTNYTGLKETPVLTFNVMIKNVIISSLISNIIPILIIAVMAFLLPFTVDKIDGEIKEGGALNIIQAAAGFFFVLLLSHIQLRNTIETQGLIYLETFYFVMYFMLAIMSTAVLLFLKTNKYPVLEYKHNLIFKLSYWPILLLSIYLITIIIFY